ncbi:hypothetical protein QTP86_028919 [Hemibagrus guttatus]|nr:hypothetical protein QTP86_028919 [Hemibagrus guttatus]
MVMSQGTYTFLACFAGFWLIWALIVMVCCFCSFVQRKLKRRREERLREQCLRDLEMEPLECTGVPYPPRETPQFCPPLQMMSPQLPVTHTIPQGSWMPPPATILPVDNDACGKPPCYEEAVLMEDPPPPYSEVLADPRGGMFTKPVLRSSREHQDSETRKMAPVTVFSERGYSSLIRLPSARRWDSLDHLLSNVDLNHSSMALEPHASAMATMPRDGRIHMDFGLRGLRPLDHSYGLPTAFPLLGRSTAV